MPLLRKSAIHQIAPEMNSTFPQRGAAGSEPYSPEEYPICLSDSGSFASDGSRWTPNSEALQNTYSRAIQIEEMSFLLSATAQTLVKQSVLGFSVRMALHMDRFQLTADGAQQSGNGVPLAMLQPSIDDRLQFCHGGKPLSAPLGSFNYFYYYKWRLPVPMIVPTNSVLMPVFYWQNPDGTVGVTNGSQPTINISVTMRGRSLLGQMPAKIKVPFATCWSAKTGYNDSTSQDLYNPFNSMLHVQRLIGRIVTFQSRPFIQEVNISSNKLQITDGSGVIINRRRDEWSSLFDPQRAAWNMNRDVGVGQRYTVSLADAPATATYFPMISMIGYREEGLS